MCAQIVERGRSSDMFLCAKLFLFFRHYLGGMSVSFKRDKTVVQADAKKHC